jgi:Fic family protein
MRREQLVSRLRTPYTPDKACGVAHVPNPGYENIWFVVPPAPPTDLPPDMPVGVIGKAVSLLQGRPHWSAASPLDKLATYLFARREAVSSSRMEGTWSTIDNILTPGELYEGDAGKSDHKSVRGYAAALDYGYGEIEQGGISALTIELVCTLHELVMSKDPEFYGIPGRVRAPGLAGDVVLIGGGGRKEDSVYNPTPPDQTARCLGDVIAWLTDKAAIELSDAGMGMSLPIRMAIGHSHFEAVHPFSNGNGRVGRILWPLQMMASGHLPLYLSGYVEQNRHEYGQALQEAQKQLSYGRIVNFVCEAVIVSSAEEKLSQSLIGDFPNLWRARGKFRKGSAAYNAVNVLTRMPIITANLLAKELTVSFQAASGALNALQRNAIVRERTGQGRNRIFAAEEVIAVLSRPFGEDPEIALEGARNTLERGAKAVSRVNLRAKDG